MTTLTIRIDDNLKGKAFKQAEKLGIPITLVVVNALETFVKKPRVIIGEPELVKLTPALQKKINKLEKLISTLDKKGKLPKKSLSEQLRDL